MEKIWSRSAGVPVRNRVQLIAEIQRELTRRGFYDGTADGVAFDHAIGLHLIDECNYFNNVHGMECQAANWLRET